MDNIMYSKQLVGILLSVGIVIWASSFFTLRYTRKVKIQNRTNKKNDTYSKTKMILIDYLENKSWFNALRKKIAIGISYDSDKSERKNLELATNKIFRNFKIVVVQSIAIILLLTLPILIKLLICIGILTIEILFKEKSISNKKNKMKNEFPIFLSAFISNYVQSTNVREAFKSCIPEITPSYSRHIKRVVNAINSGESIAATMDKFDERIDYTMCSCFVAVIKSSTKTNKTVVSSLLELETLIAKDLINDKTNKDKLQESINNIYFLVVCVLIELYFVGNYVQGVTGNYFLATPEGQALLLASIGAIITAVVFSYLAKKL